MTRSEERKVIAAFSKRGVTAWVTPKGVKVVIPSGMECRFQDPHVALLFVKQVCKSTVT